MFETLECFNPHQITNSTSLLYFYAYVDIEYYSSSVVIDFSIDLKITLFASKLFHLLESITLTLTTSIEMLKGGSNGNG